MRKQQSAVDPEAGSLAADHVREAYQEPPRSSWPRASAANAKALVAIGRIVSWSLVAIAVAAFAAAIVGREMLVAFAAGLALLANAVLVGCGAEILAVLASRKDAE